MLDYRKLLGLAPQEEIEIPYRPEDQMEPVVEEVQDDPVEEKSFGLDTDHVDESLQAFKEQGRDPSSEEPTDSTDVDPRQSMLDEYRELMKQRQEGVSAGRQADIDAEMYNNLNKAFQQMGTGLASGYANVKMKPIEMPKSKLGKQAEGDHKANIQGLMDEYKLAKMGEKDPLKELEKRVKKKELLAKEKKYDGVKDTKQLAPEFEKELQKQQAKKYVETQDKSQQAQADDNMIDDALSSFLDYSKSKIGGTGPIATAGGLSKYFSEDTENLDAKFKNLGLSKMTKMFAGMSKAVDSDAERRAFESTVASIKNDDNTNAKILLGAKAINLRNKAEAKAQQKHLESGNSDLSNYKSPIMSVPTSVVVDPQSGRFRLVKKKDLDKAKRKGFLDLDSYSKVLIGE